MNNYIRMNDIAQLEEVVKHVPGTQQYRVEQTVYIERPNKEPLPYVERSSMIGSLELIELYRAYKAERLCFYQPKTEKALRTSLAPAQQ